MLTENIVKIYLLSHVCRVQNFSLIFVVVETSGEGNAGGSC